jgi:hypothetical protein
MKIQYNDGGRAAAGYVGYANDCAVRAIAITTKKPYQEVYDALNDMARRERPSKRKPSRSSSRGGVYRVTSDRYLKSLGWRWTATTGIGQGCRVHLREDELPGGRLIVRVTKHLTAVIDGVIHDVGIDLRGGTRCVYGYWSLAGTPPPKTDPGDGLTYTRSMDNLLRASVTVIVRLTAEEVQALKQYALEMYRYPNWQENAQAFCEWALKKELRRIKQEREAQ